MVASARAMTNKALCTLVLAVRMRTKTKCCGCIGMDAIVEGAKSNVAMETPHPEYGLGFLIRLYFAVPLDFGNRPQPSTAAMMDLGYRQSPTTTSLTRSGWNCHHTCPSN